MTLHGALGPIGVTLDDGFDDLRVFVGDALDVLGGVLARAQTGQPVAVRLVPQPFEDVAER